MKLIQDSYKYGLHSNASSRNDDDRSTSNRTRYRLSKYPNIQSTPDKVEIRDTFSSFDAVGYFVEYLGLINAL
jgi:hypothetical protein